VVDLLVTLLVVLLTFHSTYDV